jgi:hypothetical protein
VSGRNIDAYAILRFNVSAISYNTLVLDEGRNMTSEKGKGQRKRKRERERERERE